ncbi:MAG: Mrp/NBP35 family ATP-binding protein [Parvularculales bacterium]
MTLSISREEIGNILKHVAIPKELAPEEPMGTSCADILLQGFTVHKKRMSVILSVPSEHAQEPKRIQEYESLRIACEEALRHALDIEEANVILTAHRETGTPASASPPLPKRHGHCPDGKKFKEALTLKNIHSIVAVASGKGGVGKSTVAVNLALGLAALGLRVGILDADIYGPSLPRMMGLTGKPDSDGGKKIVPMEQYGLKCMSIGLLVEEDAPVIWRGPMVQSAFIQLLKDVAWGDLDVLVLDMPPGTGDVQLTLAQRVPLTGAVIVSTPQEVALADVRRSVNMFRRTGIDVLGVVQNMAWFTPPGGIDKFYPFGKEGVRRTAEQLNLELLADIPLEIEIQEGMDIGRPLMGSAPDSPSAQPFKALAETVAKHLKKVGA